jgi:ABC-type cobalamin/Fe3+-siderophores transport system ATPase subunit
MSKLTDSDEALIAVVGPCGAGKSTLVDGLINQGFRARQIAQEHSYVPRMWQLLTQPEVLIYVDAGFASCTERKKLNWSRSDYERQIERLAHARQHCDIYLNSDGIDAQQALKHVLEALMPLLPSEPHG